MEQITKKYYCVFHKTLSHFLSQVVHYHDTRYNIPEIKTDEGTSNNDLSQIHL